jgi:predicted DNA-binding transcriptional regulator AlpA
MDHATKTTLNTVLTETEAAALLQVTRFALRKWRRSGLGPRFVRCGGRLVRYVQADIDSWLAQRKFHSNAHELSAASKE